MCEGSVVAVVTDASPTGLGGEIVEDDAIQEYFGCSITEADQHILGAQKGTCEGRQVWEALAVLCALHMWSTRQDRQRSSARDDRQDEGEGDKRQHRGPRVGLGHCRGSLRADGVRSRSRGVQYARILLIAIG